MAKQKFYVVWVGRQTGVFTNWGECEAQVKGFSGAKFKSFKTRNEADDAFINGIPDTSPLTSTDALDDVPWETGIKS